MLGIEGDFLTAVDGNIIPILYNIRLQTILILMAKLVSGKGAFYTNFSITVAVNLTLSFLCARFLSGKEGTVMYYVYNLSLIHI